MEKIKEFIETPDYSGVYSGYGSGSGNGYGSGYGDGYGSGYGDGYGSGYGYGYGSGSGDGYGDGYGYGSGDGYGDGYGSGNGYGYGYGISSFNGMEVHQIDNVPTIIKTVRGNIAKGYILVDDMTLSPCYVAKGQNLFAHGETAQKAVQALQEKIYANMDTDAAIETFLQEFPDCEKKYPAKDFYIWHNRLTGSCEMGRNKFVTEHGFDLEHDTFTVQEFIDITKNYFGGYVIRQLEKHMKGDAE